MLYHILPRETLDKTTVAIVDDIKKYFEKYPSREVVDLSEFVPRFEAWHPGLSVEQKNAFNAVFRNMQQEADDDSRANIISELAELNMMTRLANLSAQFSNGELPYSYSAITEVMDEYKLRIGVRNASYIETDIADLLKLEFDNSGLKWRLHCLNNSMRGLRPGDFGIIAGRPDKGKTSFIASECTFMAAQLPADQNILWLNNEGPGERIIPRLYQAALGASIEDLKAKQTANTIKDEYTKVMGGRLDRIRIFDIHGYDNGMVEMIIEEHQPGLIIYDMIDNIKGFGGEARNDLKLEEMYKWARERSVKYGAVGLATSQISSEGDGLQYPTLGMLKDSKTGKQGACDFQLMLGASNEPTLSSSRFIGLPKNKLRRPGNPSDPRADVWFDADKCRYTDREITLTSAEAEELTQ